MILAPRGVQHVQERRDRAAVETATELEVGADLGARDAQRVADVARHQKRAQIRGDRIETAARDDARASRRRLVVITAGDLSHPRRLARDVDVVRAEPHAGVHNRRAIERKRARGAEHDPRPCHDGVDGGLILTGCDDQIRVAQASACGLTRRFERVTTRAGNRPAEAGGRVGREVGHRLPPGEAAGAVEEDVVVAVGWG